MKNKLQTTRTSFSRSPRWLSKFFHFGTENRADQLKKTPCRCAMLSSPWDDQLFSIKCLKLFDFVCLWHTQHCFEKEISWSIISSFCFFSSVQILNMAIMTTFQSEKYTFCCENVSAIKSSLDDDTVTLISNIWLGERKYRGSNFEESFCRQIAFQCYQTFMAWLKSLSILLFWML